MQPVEHRRGRVGQHRHHGRELARASVQGQVGQLEVGAGEEPIAEAADVRLPQKRRPPSPRMATVWPGSAGLDVCDVMIDGTASVLQRQGAVVMAMARPKQSCSVPNAEAGAGLAG